jgi:pyridinium-3,5-bisthiocarboxylic acid mononucleotide nickel chelatase
VGFLTTYHPPNQEHTDDQMLKLEVNLDNISGEWLGYVMDLLFDAGANDVFYTPIYMKKNRPAVLLQLLCSIKKVSAMKEILFKETTTLGVRYYPLTVHRLERVFQEVPTQWGIVTVKIGLYEGEVVQKAPEFEECRQIAEQQQIPLKLVYEEVWKAYNRLNEQK